MDETSLRARLELAVADEPPLGHLVGNALRDGRRLRRRRRTIGGAALSATAVVLVAAVPALTAGADHQAGRSRPAAGQRPESGTAYVTVGSSVVPISLATNTPGPPIRVPEVIGDGPFVTNAAASPNGRTIYEVGFDGGTGSTITPVDTATNTAGPTITIKNAADVQRFAVAPNGKSGYLSATEGLFRISFATGTASQLTGCRRCGYGAIAFAPNGRTLYAISFESRTVTVVKTASNTVRASIAFPAAADTAPRQIAITPDGKTAFVLFSPAGAKPGASSVLPINLATNTALAPIRIAAPGFADNLLIAPDGRTAYVLSTGAVTAINTATTRAEATISLPQVAGDAYYMVLAANGQILYVLTPRGIVPVSTASGAVLPMIKVPHLHTFTVMAITPDGRIIYVGATMTRTERGQRFPSIVSAGVVPIDTATGIAGRYVQLGTEPDAIVFAP
jgi:DNA-binding beta-propeller fold protein YncE